MNLAARVSTVAQDRTCRARILVLIDQMQGFTHFVGHGAFDALAARHDLRFASPPAGEELGAIDPLDYVDAARWHPVEPDPARTSAWFRLALLAQVRPGISAYRRRLRRMRLYPFRRMQRLATTALALPGPRWVYSHMVRRRLLATPHAALARLLDEQQPDIVLYPSALNGALINDGLLACRARRIATVVLMDSWDNPSTKNATYLPPDWLLVWGEQTRRHAVDYMGLPDERVVPLGAAQLELLRHADVAAERAAFRAAYGMTAEQRVILYAAATIRPADLDALAALDDTIARGELPRCTILYRPYPDMDRAELDRIVARGLRHVVVQRDAVPAPGARGAEVQRAQEAAKIGALAAADAVISPLSTILLEAAMLGRPVLCYFPQTVMVAKFRRGNAPLVHFDDFLAVPEILAADRTEALVPSTRLLLERAAEPGIASRLRAACRHFVADDSQPYADRLADFVETVLAAQLDLASNTAARRSVP